MIQITGRCNLIHALLAIVLFLWSSEVCLGGEADILGCGGFLQSHVPIDYAKVEVRLITKQGIIKDKTNCAPNNGYYFVPLYDKGESEFILQLSPPIGWSFTPKEVHLNIDGTDACSLGKDINFVFDGFGITGKVESFESDQGGPKGVTVSLKSKAGTRTAETQEGGAFSFSPVYPGIYTVFISHPKWKILKPSTEVKVAEGNTDLPPKSLMIQGYGVKGTIQTAEGYPVENLVVALFAKNNGKTVNVENCNKNALGELKKNEKFLCHVKSNLKGEFIFPVVSFGSYYVTLYFPENNIYFQPEKIDFSVAHEDVVISDRFKIIGFSVAGRILNGKNQPISNAKIILNGEEVTRSDATGHYRLEKLTVGNYRLKAESDDLIFDEIALDINTNTLKLPDLKPSAYKVCGKVTSDKPQTIIFKQVGSTSYLQTETNDNQQFCQYLPRGKYEIEIKISEDDRKNGMLFFPINQMIEVKSENILDLLFSQMKSSISGKVDCILEKDCEELSVILESGFDKITAPVKGSKYTVDDMHPGIYEVTLVQNKYCWNTNTHNVNVNSVSATVPDFVQKGYLVNFVSSHDVKVICKSSQGKTKELDLIIGVTPVCLDAPGQYSFILKSCHNFTSNTISYDTSSANNQITLNAVKHTSTVHLQSETNHGPIEIDVNYGNIKTKQTVNYQNGRYKLELMLNPSEVVIITPLSDFLVFAPSSVQIEGASDCIDLGNKITVSKGKVISGKISPPLKDVLITVEGLPEGQVLKTMTDSDGAYKFPPLDDRNTFTVKASKDSYILTGPDDRGHFKAQKLAEIIVEVVDTDKNPLPGVLLSLSGGSSYRKNLQTGSNGKISFHSLGSGEYFLRPMMKEYEFDPTSKIISIPEGETVQVQLSGKRVAFSAFGRVTTLNEEPVKDLNIVASGLNNCTSYEEDATADASGHFRIRGLQPHCSFRIYIQVTNKYDSLVERTAPHYIEIQDVTQDIRDLHFTVFHPISTLDVMIKVHAENTDHYRSLKLKVLQEDDQGSQVYSTYIENHLKSIKDKRNGILVHLPTMQADGKTYSVHLEHSYMKNKSPVKYFVANSSFKYVEMDYFVKVNRTEQPIKQTSIWFVAFLVLVLVVVFKLQTILDFAKEHINVNLSLQDLNKFIPIPSKKKVERNYDADIDQIVQDINNVRKRPKKVFT